MKCCGIHGIGDLERLFRFTSRKSFMKHFTFMQMERPHERGGLYELFYIRKHCKHTGHFEKGWRDK